MNKYLNVAKAVSLTSEHPKVKIGACIVKSHYIVTVGVNNNKSHPKQKHYNRYRPRFIRHDNLHAEMSAILKAEKLLDDFHGATIYIYRENSLKHLAMCKPCPACMAKIKEVGIKKVVYTDENGINTLVLK